MIARVIRTLDAADRWVSRHRFRVVRSALGAAVAGVGLVVAGAELGVPVLVDLAVALWIAGFVGFVWAARHGSGEQGGGGGGPTSIGDW